MDVPKLYQSMYAKAMTGKSLRAAVNIKCLDCTCYQRTMVRDCPVENCSLHLYRPYQKTSSEQPPPAKGDLSPGNRK